MSQKNIDRLLGLVKHRLNSSGKMKSLDDKGNVVYVNCDIYSDEMLTAFLQLSLSDFNQVPYFTFYTFADDNFVEVFAEVLVMGAVIQALAAQALLEKGREFQISDQGIDFVPPTVSEMLNTQYSTLLNVHFDKLKYIKREIQSFKK